MLKQKDRKITNCKIIYSYSVKAHRFFKKLVGIKRDIIYIENLPLCLLDNIIFLTVNFIHI